MMVLLFFLRIGATRKLTQPGSALRVNIINNLKIGGKKSEISDSTYTTL
jgi:hypothetical protein